MKSENHEICQYLMISSMEQGCGKNQRNFAHFVMYNVYKLFLSPEKFHRVKKVAFGL
jgi:hypothetical protein